MWVIWLCLFDILGHNARIPERALWKEAAFLKELHLSNIASSCDRDAAMKVASFIILFVSSVQIVWTFQKFLPYINAPVYDLALSGDKINLNWQVDYERQEVIFEISFFQPKFRGK